MRRGFFPLFGFALCSVIALAAFSTSTMAQTLTGAPPLPIASAPLPMPPTADAQGQPTDLLGLPPADANAPPPAPATNAMPVTAVGSVPVPPDAPTDSQSQLAAAPPMTAPVAVADPVSACSGSASDASDCLKKLDDQTMAELNRMQTDKLKALRKGSDWKQGRLDSQSLANSAMSFEAYRDTECARQKKGHDGDEADNIFMSCQIKMSQDRIALLQHP
jgi:hypothetical protein